MTSSTCIADLVPFVDNGEVVNPLALQRNSSADAAEPCSDHDNS